MLSEVVVLVVDMLGSGMEFLGTYELYGSCVILKQSCVEVRRCPTNGDPMVLSFPCNVCEVDKGL